MREGLARPPHLQTLLKLQSGQECMWHQGRINRINANKGGCRLQLRDDLPCMAF